MSKGILIAGNDSALLSAIEAETAERTGRYALAFIPNRFSEFRGKSSGATAASQESARILLDWNPGSPVSARSLVLASENRLERIDEALLVCAPPSISCAAADLKHVDVEVMANDNIKSWFFLVRELAASFKRRGQGTLALVYPEAGIGGKGDDADILGSVAVASFRSLAQRLLATATGEAYVVQGFTSGETGNEAAFASFIFKQLDDTKRRAGGKLHKYGRSGFFK